MRYKEFDKKLKPAIPMIYLYDNAGDQEFTNTGAFHTWDTTEVRTSDFQYTSDTDKVTFVSSTSGLYKITFECSFRHSAYKESVTTNIYKNGGTVAGGRCYEAGDRWLNHNITCIIYLKKGDYLQVHTITSDDECSAISMWASSRLIIEYISMSGANNTTGGNPPMLLR
jgi:hypothetical protein